MKVKDFTKGSEFLQANSNDEECKKESKNQKLSNNISIFFGGGGQKCWVVKIILGQTFSGALMPEQSACAMGNRGPPLAYAILFNINIAYNNLGSVIGCHELAAAGAKLNEGQGLYQGF